MIVTFAPAGLEQYFVELFDLIRANPGDAGDLRALIERLADRYDFVVVGPPPGARRG